MRTSSPLCASDLEQSLLKRPAGGMPATAVVSGGHEASKAQNGHRVDHPSSRPAPMDVDAPSSGQNGWAGKGGAGGHAQQSACAPKEQGAHDQQSALLEQEAHDPAAGPPTTSVAFWRPGKEATAVGAAGAMPSAAVVASQANSVPLAANGSSQQQQQQQQQQQDDGSTTAVVELEAILNRVAQLDAEGWFQARSPVSTLFNAMQYHVCAHRTLLLLLPHPVCTLQAPVREQDAPRYYQIIKQPMCFQVRIPSTGQSPRAAKARHV